MLNTIANALFGLVTLAVLLCALWWGIHRPLFSLVSVRVEGFEQRDLRHVNALTIRDQALPQIAGNFFTANIDDIRRAFEGVAWVRQASVQRVWPNKLVVTLKEHEVLGTWGEDERLISSNGDIFTANLAEAEEDGKLVELMGPVGSEKEVLQQYRKFCEWFKVLGLVPESVQYSSRYAWTLKLDNGLRVELGKVQDVNGLKKRVDQLITVYPQLVTRLQGNIVSVDMRYPNGLALKTNNTTAPKKAR
ncbi:MAG: cell division protein FtsQ/DivIB [Undibacterium sp.]|nr:cell division protein FtsQ/DivIB [Undibacterium sp.]